MRIADMYKTNKLVEKLNRELAEREVIHGTINSDRRLGLPVVIEALSSESQQKTGNILSWRNRPLFRLQTLVTEKESKIIESRNLIHSLVMIGNLLTFLRKKTLYPALLTRGLGMAEQAITTLLAPMSLESVLTNDEPCAGHERFTGRHAIRAIQPCIVNNRQCISESSTRQELYADMHGYTRTAKSWLHNTWFKGWVVVREDQNNTTEEHFNGTESDKTMA